MLQRPGYPNVSIKLYQNYDAWLENRFAELAATFITMTIRDALFNGINEGLLQIFDDKNIHTKLTGDEIIQISLKTANTEATFNRVYAIKHFSVSVDSKGDNKILFQLNPYHHNVNLKFGRAFSNNAFDSYTEMLNYIYKDSSKIQPKTYPMNIRVPKTNWCLGISEYAKFIRDHGVSVEQEEPVMLWEDMTGIHFSDYKTMVDQTPLRYVVTEPKLVGELSNITNVGIVFDFEWLTKANAYTRNPYRDVSFYASSYTDKSSIQTIAGEGLNSVSISRNGAYFDQIQRDGKEEYQRMINFSRYDGYVSTKTYGDFSLTPGLKLNFYDKKDQFGAHFYIDEVIHEISREQSITNIFAFTNSEALTTIDLKGVQ